MRLTHPLDRECLVAVSGGLDSMVALHWLSQIKGRARGIVHVNHGTGKFADEAEALVRDKAQEVGLDLFLRRLTRVPEPGKSLENHWREQRYRFFLETSATQSNLPVVVAHQLDDCLEEYIMCTMIRGYFGTIPYRHGPCVRPFRLWRREDILIYARQNDLLWVEDPSNLDHTKFTRAKIRWRVVPRIRKLNPGVYKIVEKAIREQDSRDLLQARSSIG